MNAGARSLANGIYETADAQWITFGAVEPKFRAGLLLRLGIDPEELGGPPSWGPLRQRIAGLVRGRTRAQWEELLAGADVTFAPVLSHEQALRHPHHVARRSFVDVDGQSQVAPGPRFARTPAGPPRPAPGPGADTRAVLAELGLSQDEVAALEHDRVVAAAP